MARGQVMQRLADDLELLDGFPPFGINIYVMGQVLVDAGTLYARRRILRQVRGRSLKARRADACTPGSSREQPRDLRSPGNSLVVRGSRRLGDGDGRRDYGPDAAPIGSLQRLVRTGSVPRIPWRTRLHEGDEVGGFRVLETPGHTLGHVSFWREHDRTLVMGDVLANIHIWTGLASLQEPQRIFSLDPLMNRRSAARLAELEPRLTCFGHGPPLRDPRRLLEFVSRFPRSASSQTDDLGH